ncbi:MAG: Os1348 family NHLP clan protein [Thermoleophilia bacterium]
MARKGVAVIIGRAVVDENYRRLLKEQPHAAFEGYELTGAEMQALAGIDHKSLETLAESLESRMKSWYVSWAIHR